MMRSTAQLHIRLLRSEGKLENAGKLNQPIYGAYIKLDNAEAVEAKKKKVFNRSFSMEVEESFYDELIAYVDHKVKRRELGLE